MTTRRTPILLSVAAVIVLAAVAVAFGLGAFTRSGSGRPLGPGVDPGGATRLFGTWQPVKIPGYVARAPWPDPFPGARITFASDGTWSGSDGCNHLGGSYTASPDGEFAIGTSSSTEIGCANVPNGDVLGRARSFVVKGATLTFRGPDGTLLGRYVRAAVS